GGRPMPDVLLERVRPGIVVLTLNRPERLNALTMGLLGELLDACAEVQRDNTCRVVVLTGAGRGFCSGLDLKEIGPSPVTHGLPLGPQAGLLGQEWASSVVPAIYRLQQPVVAAINGPAF